jgi:CheY-like chemotaxis protein
MPDRESRLRVLVVDDDKGFLELMRMWLSPRHEVLCSRDGSDLLEDLDAFQPDLVILDVHMPDPNGFALCRRIRAHPRHGRVPVLFLTASEEDPDFQEHLASKGNGYLMKPVQEREVLLTVKDMVSRWPVRAMLP